MPRTQTRIPSYCHHKASGQAVVRIDGKDHYLGAFGSADSHEKYARLLAEWRSNETIQFDPSPSSQSVQTVPNLILVAVVAELGL